MPIFAAQFDRLRLKLVQAWAGALAISVIGGCASVGPTPAAEPRELTVAQTDYRQAFEAGVAVLRDAGFQLDRQDFRFGQISSKPQGSPTVLEPWKPDNVRSEEAWLSTLGNLRRTVRVSIEPKVQAQSAADPNQDYRLSVEVVIERLQVPARRMNGRTKGRVFADLSEVPVELQERGITQSYWQPIGRDLALEQRLTQQIIEQSRQTPS